MAQSEGLPRPIVRAVYFRGIMEGKPLSATNRLLAQALAKPVLGKLLLTTNFDDHIERAINRLGRAPAIVEAPEAIHRLELDSPHPKIGYLHGKFVFNDLAHAPAESTLRKSPMLPWVRTLMIERPPSCLAIAAKWKTFSSPPCVGALARRPASAPPAYWFCFDPSDAPRIAAKFTNLPACCWRAEPLSHSSTLR